MSSSWRTIPKAAEKLNNKLESYGMPHCIGMTPQLGSRESEVYSWLSSCAASVDRWVAVDDLLLDLPSDHYVRTHRNKGLTPTHTDQIVYLLTEGGSKKERRVPSTLPPMLPVCRDAPPATRPTPSTPPSDIDASSSVSTSTSTPPRGSANSHGVVHLSLLKERSSSSDWLTHRKKSRGASGSSDWWDAEKSTSASTSVPSDLDALASSTPTWTEEDFDLCCIADAPGDNGLGISSSLGIDYILPSSGEKPNGALGAFVLLDPSACPPASDLISASAALPVLLQSPSS